MAFHNFEFHTSLWFSVRLLCDIRSFAAKDFPPSSCLSCGYMNGFSCSVRGLWHKSFTSENCCQFQQIVDRHFHGPVTFTVQSSKGSRSQISSKQIITIADEAEITASTNVLLIYISKSKDCFVRYVRARSDRTELVYQLPVELRTLCQWPMKYRAQTHLPRGHRFPVPLDKGNEGSGDEIAHTWVCFQCVGTDTSYWSGLDVVITLSKQSFCRLNFIRTCNFHLLS